MDNSTPIWQLTVGQFQNLLRETVKEVIPEPVESELPEYVYGLEGIMQIYNCSKSTAQRIKPLLGNAVQQIGRKIIVKTSLALENYRK